MMNIVDRFKKRFPSISFEFKEGNFEECVNYLKKNQVDVSFGLDCEFKDDSQIISQTLYQFELCIICSYNHPLAQKNEVSIHELCNKDFVVLSEKFGKKFYEEFMNSFEKDGFHPRISKSVDFLDELIFYVTAQEGIALLSTNVVKDASVKKLKLLDTNHSSNYVIGYHSSLKDPLVKDFIQETIDYYKTL